jgi:hemerythrin-like domain-containing protein
MAEEGSDEAAECSAPDPIAALEEEHGLHLELCAVLEHIADGLPDNADRKLAVVAIAILQHGWPKHIRCEEDVLFPLLRARAGPARCIDPVLAQLEHEHATDEGLANEIVEEFEILTKHGRVSNPDMLGYMLRAFFEAQRRHVRWENSVVLPLAREVLTEEDRLSLQTWLVSNGRPACSKRSLIALRRAGTEDVCADCDLREVHH